jgi:hypothetical protein
MWSAIYVALPGNLSFVMPGLVPGIHAFLSLSKTWMARAIGERSDAVFDGYARP